MKLLKVQELAIIVCIVALSCTNRDVFGKYNAQEYGKYSSVEIKNDEFARLRCTQEKIDYLVKYKIKDDYLYVKIGEKYENFRIIDKETLQGINEAFPSERVFYRKNYLNTDTKDNDLVALIESEYSDYPIFEYIPMGEMKILDKENKKVEISILLGLGIENIAENRRIVKEHMEMIKEIIRECVLVRGKQDLESEKEVKLKSDIMNGVNERINNATIKNIIIDKLFIEL